MEQQNSQQSSPIVCKAGCGFFGSSSMDGMCSKCYKEALQKKMQVPASSSSSTSSSMSSSTQQDPSKMASHIMTTTTVASSPLQIPQSSMAKPASGASLASVDSSTSLDSAVSLSVSSASLPAGAAGLLLSSTPDSSLLSTSSPNSVSAKGKNRCATCNKKVGLTGFECRCGGMFCSTHRYSDMHQCSFDYRQMGAEEIRKNNPAVRAEKVAKL